MYRSGIFLTAMDTGNLTVSIDYSLRHIGVASLPNGIESRAIAQLLLGRSNEAPLVEDRELSSASGDGIQTGTLRLTRSFQSGEGASFSITASVLADRGPSLPVPDMLWPTLGGMIGIAFWAERRRRKAGFAGSAG